MGMGCSHQIPAYNLLPSFYLVAVFFARDSRTQRGFHSALWHYSLPRVPLPLPSPQLPPHTSFVSPFRAVCCEGKTLNTEEQTLDAGLHTHTPAVGSDKQPASCSFIMREGRVPLVEKEHHFIGCHTAVFSTKLGKIPSISPSRRLVRQIKYVGGRWREGVLPQWMRQTGLYGWGAAHQRPHSQKSFRNDTYRLGNEIV